MAASGKDELFPDIEPFEKGMLKVSDLHTIYYEQSGKSDGNPVIFLHGGPGGGTSAKDRRNFDPDVYRIVVFDQRGAGKSTPPAELKDNNTWALVSDIEKLREKLGIEKWVVFGGSWGSTLALTYAETHPDRVKALVLRGIFTFTRKELLWFNQEGASFIFPDAFEKYVEPIPEVERGELIGAYYRRLTGNNEEERLRCAKAWSTWECATACLRQDPGILSRTESDVWSLQNARIESHYLVNGGFFRSDGQILDDVDKIRHIPCTIIHGRYDMACPVYVAWALHKKFPEADFHLVPDAGHSHEEPGIKRLLIQATEKYKHL